MGDIKIMMMHMPPTMAERLQATEWPDIKHINVVNYFFMVGIFG